MSNKILKCINYFPQVIYYMWFFIIFLKYVFGLAPSRRSWKLLWSAILRVLHSLPPTTVPFFKKDAGLWEEVLQMPPLTLIFKLWTLQLILYCLVTVFPCHILIWKQNPGSCKSGPVTSPHGAACSSVFLMYAEGCFCFSCLSGMWDDASCEDRIFLVLSATSSPCFQYLEFFSWDPFLTSLF